MSAEATVMTRPDAGRGCLPGALAEDATRASLEFLGRTPEEAGVDSAMRMVGGGPYGTAPGQITDDGELSLCLARALAGISTFSTEKAALEYLAWLRSNPFYGGNATTNGLSGAHAAATGEVHEGMWRAAAHHNSDSKANGARMRVTPLGIWGWRMVMEDLVAAVSATCISVRRTPRRCARRCSAVVTRKRMPVYSAVSSANPTASRAYRAPWPKR
jgi:ADP-ribosyl-[dinitrogen reductase] hydrolase